MSFTIRYKKTGKEIELSNKALYLHLDVRWLEQLGFKSAELWEEEEIKMEKETKVYGHPVEPRGAVGYGIGVFGMGGYKKKKVEVILNER